MRPRLLLGLCLAATLAVPAVAAHLVYAVPFPSQEGVGCAVLWIGRPDLGPHAVGDAFPCSPPSHSAPMSLP